MTDNKTIVNALRRFIKLFRAEYGETEYVKVVEYNQRHTQPHFHLIFCLKSWDYGKQPESIERDESWPEPVHQNITKLWSEALRYYAPDKKDTFITWCQQPRGNAAAVKYAVKYATGGSKNEEPDETWQGRKISYSRHFLPTAAQKIWQQLLEKWFPDRGEIGLVINPDATIDDLIAIPLIANKHIHHKLSTTRYKLFQKNNEKFLQEIEEKLYKSRPPLYKDKWDDTFSPN